MISGRVPSAPRDFSAEIQIETWGMGTRNSSRLIPDFENRSVRSWGYRTRFPLQNTTSRRRSLSSNARIWTLSFLVSVFGGSKGEVGSGL